MGASHRSVEVALASHGLSHQLGDTRHYTAALAGRRTARDQHTRNLLALAEQTEAGS
jgi:hypothetical protein